MERWIIAGLSIGADGKLLEKISLPSVTCAEDPADVAFAYADEGADEVLFRSVASSIEALITLSRRVSSSLRIPHTIENDATNPDRVAALLDAGASRVVIQVAGLREPDYIARLVRSFGSERIAVKIVSSSEADGWRVLEAAEGVESEWSAVTWARVVETQGAGSVFVESAARSATAPPFDLDLLATLKSAVAIPVIASGAAERVEDLFDALMIGNADGIVVGALAHSGRASVGEVKAYLSDHGLGGWEVEVTE